MQQTSLTVICTAAIFSWPGNYYLSVPAVTWRTPVINYLRVFSPLSISLLAPWRIIRINHLSLGNQSLVGGTEPWPTPRHLLWFPKRQKVLVGHLPLFKGSGRSPQPPAPCRILSAASSGSVFGATAWVPGRRRRAWLSHCPEWMVQQICTPASDSKHQAPLFPAPQENKWETRRQLQKMFSRLCLCNGEREK